MTRHAPKAVPSRHTGPHSSQTPEEWARIRRYFGEPSLTEQLSPCISPLADGRMALELIVDGNKERILEFTFTPEGKLDIPYGYLKPQPCCRANQWIDIPNLTRVCGACRREILLPEADRGVLSRLLHCVIDAWNSYLSTQTRSKVQRGPLPLLIEDHYCVMNPSHYHALREALAKNTFHKVEESPWPTATLARRNSTGHAQLLPLALDNQPLIPYEDRENWIEQMWKQREELSDLDADALDAISAVWLSQAKTPNDDAFAGVNQLLSMRGIKPKRSGHDHDGGYMPQQRLEILKALSRIQNLWITMTDLEIYEFQHGKKGRSTRQNIQSRAFVITDRIGQLHLDGFSMDVRKFIFRPGKVFAHFLFGPGRQTALLSANALRYDPYRQKWEKRLVRYLSWRWRIQARNGTYSQSFRVDTLLNAVGQEISSRRPDRIKERLETALDTLQENGDIAAWQYEKERWNENMVGCKGWVEGWKTIPLLIEPPAIIRDTYRSIEKTDKTPSTALPPAMRFGARIQEARSTRKLSQRAAAMELNISQPFLSKLERDLLSSLSPSLLQRLEAWLAK